MLGKNRLWRIQLTHFPDTFLLPPHRLAQPVNASIRHRDVTPVTSVPSALTADCEWILWADSFLVNRQHKALWVKSYSTDFYKSVLFGESKTKYYQCGSIPKWFLRVSSFKWIKNIQHDHFSQINEHLNYFIILQWNCTSFFNLSSSKVLK